MTTIKDQKRVLKKIKKQVTDHQKNEKMLRGQLREVLKKNVNAKLEEKIK
jgi:hypothetical protein